MQIWHPADLFSNSPNAHRDFALIVLNQPLELRAPFYLRIWKNAVYHVGADGGANRVYDLDHSTSGCIVGLDTIIGDLDSVRPEVQAYWRVLGSEIIHDRDQYSTDFMKATRYLKTFEVGKDAHCTHSNDVSRRAKLQAVQDGPGIKDIVAIGGLGGRVDQGMSTLHHLYTFQNEGSYEAGRMFLLSSESITFVLKSGKHKIKVRESYPEMSLGKHIGIIPLKEPSVITTKGLEWDVEDWHTEFGGQISTSNHVKEDWVTIETTKDVLFTIDLAEPSI
jgi:thiamine pyrophosphokinase